MFLLVTGLLLDNYIAANSACIVTTLDGWAELPFLKERKQSSLRMKCREGSVLSDRMKGLAGPGLPVGRKKSISSQQTSSFS